jgi:hypothetical protein
MCSKWRTRILDWAIFLALFLFCGGVVYLLAPILD